MQNVALKEKINKPYDLNDPIIHFYKQINECLKLAGDADTTKFNTRQALQQDLYDLQATRLYREHLNE